MKTLREYVREQLDDNSNVLITEGKFWDWLKSLFSGKNKKSKNEYQKWLNSDNNNKKYDDIKNKLNKEFNNKSSDIFSNIGDDPSEEDVLKSINEYKKLSDKKLEILKKLNTDNEEKIEKASNEVKKAIAIECAAEELKSLRDWGNLYKHQLNFLKDNDPNKDKNLSNIVEGAKKYFNWFIESYYKDKDSEIKTAVADVFKKAKAYKYLDISDNDIKLNEKNYVEILKKSAQKENK